MSHTDIEKEAMLQNEEDKTDTKSVNKISASTSSIDKTTEQVLHSDHSSSEHSLSDGVKRIRSLSIASIGTIGILTDFSKGDKHDDKQKNRRSKW